MNGISIGFNPEGGVYVTSQFETDLNASSDDMRIADHFIDLIRQRSPAAALTLERRADDYLSLCTGEMDFLRFKYTPRARWISIDVSGLDVQVDDPRFAAQKNKNQRFWKASITDLSDLASFDDAVFGAFLKCSEA
jgi:hypothetical protein